jgi:hypothetical protein
MDTERLTHAELEALEQAAAKLPDYNAMARLSSELFDLSGGPTAAPSLDGAVADALFRASKVLIAAAAIRSAAPALIAAAKRLEEAEQEVKVWQLAEARVDLRMEAAEARATDLAKRLEEVEAELHKRDMEDIDSFHADHG